MWRLAGRSPYFARPASSGRATLRYQTEAGRAMEAARMSDLTDDELDAYILARLKMAGVDLAVLPEDDPSAPADRKGILASARRFLKSTPEAILAFEPDVQLVPPALYPASLSVAIRKEGGHAR